MAITFQTDAIILKRKNFREKDRLVTFFTSDRGKLVAQAIGSRKAESKLAGHLEPFLYTRIMVANGRRLDKVAGSVTVNAFKRLRTNLIGVSMGAYLSEMVDTFTKENERDHTTFALLHNALVTVDKYVAEGNVSRRDLTLVADHFMMHFAATQGFLFDPDRCGKCGRELTDGAVFSPSFGLLCTLHSTESLGEEILANHRAMLKIVHESSVREAQAMNIPEHDLRILHRMLMMFVRYHFETPLRSEHFVRNLFLS